MANTYTLIMPAVVVGSGGASTIDFTSIPATYTDLLLVTSLRSSTNESGDGQNPNIKFNNDSTHNSWRIIYSSGTTINNDNSTTSALLIAAVVPTNFTASTFNNMQLYIPNYAGSNYKSFSRESVVENNASAAYLALEARLWSDTAAINQITIYPTGGNFVEHSTAYLYGIKNS